jgi:outer membrane protein
MKKLLLATMLAALMAMPAPAEQRIATIDLRKVFDNYWKRQQAEAALKSTGAEMDKELKGLQEDYQKAQDDYKKLLESANDQSVTAEERDKRKTAAENKLLQLKDAESTMRTFVDTARDKLDSQKKRMRDNILTDIRAAISAKAKAGSYNMVIDSASDSFNQTPVLLYTNGENDMTDAILSQLNAGAPPSSDTAKPADQPSEKAAGGKP